MRAAGAGGLVGPPSGGGTGGLAVGGGCVGGYLIPSPTSLK